MSESCDDTYDVYNESVRKARKDHRCDACKQTIKRGEYYCRLCTVGDGMAETIKRCGACQTTHQHLRKVIEENADPDDRLWPDERLNCGLRYEDEWGDLPDEIAALAFVTSEERGKLLAGKP